MMAPARVLRRTVLASGSVLKSPSGFVSLANPKSRILTCPSWVMKRFSGFRSRWTIPLACAAAKPREICWASRSHFLTGIAPVRVRSRSVYLPTIPKRRQADRREFPRRDCQFSEFSDPHLGLLPSASCSGSGGVPEQKLDRQSRQGGIRAR